MSDIDSNSDGNSALVIDDPGEFGSIIQPGMGTLDAGGVDLSIPPSSGYKFSPDTSTKTEYPSPIWVCAECAVYFEYDDEWAYCPKCSSELAEVVRA